MYVFHHVAFPHTAYTYIDRVEVYCHAAKASLAPHGLFVMCASDLLGVETRVRKAAEDAGTYVCLWVRGPFVVEGRRRGDEELARLIYVCISTNTYAYMQQPPQA